MKRFTIIVSFLLCIICTESIYASETHWNYDSHAYEYDMSVFYNLVLLGEQITDLNDYEVGAFCGDECRGVSTIITANETPIGYLRIRSNTTQGDLIQLKVYKKSTEEIFNVVNSITFMSQDLIGMPNEPLSLKLRNNKPVKVSANNYIRAYGEENPTFDYAVDGAELEGVPYIECNADPKTPIGTYPITISMGDIVNDNVTYVNGTLTITKAPLTVKVGTYTRKQGEKNPEFTLTYEGFKNGETEAVLTKQAIAITEANEASDLGNYIVEVSGAEAENYDINFVNGTLTVTEADPITLTAQNYTREYGEGNPIFEFTTEGAILDGEPEISCEATADSPVGTYSIEIRKGNVKNYNDSYVNGTLTITKASLSIKAKSYTITRGDALPEFELIYEGFKNNETNNVLISQPVISCDATSQSQSGDYAITVSGADAHNYDISYVAGTLTINKRYYSVSVTSADLKKGTVEATPTSENVKEGTQMTLTAKPNRGYHFVKWSDETTINPNVFVVVENVSLIAEFAPNQYTMTFKLGNGSSDIIKTQEYGTELSKPDAPNKEGFTFKGWSPEVPATVPASDMTFEAIYEQAYTEVVKSEGTNIGIETDGSATVVNGDKSISTISIPEFVISSDGTLHPVTGIAEGAFADCTNLKSINVYLKEPIDLTNDGVSGISVFEGVDKSTCVLYVPYGCLDKYREAPVWGDFVHIVEMEPVSVDGLRAASIKHEEWYDVYGRKLNIQSVRKGLYIHNGRKVFKLR